MAPVASTSAGAEAPKTVVLKSADRFELKDPSIMATVASTGAVAEAPKTVVLKSADRFELKDPSIMAPVASTGAVAEAPKTVVLKSADGQEFEVELLVANQSEMIKDMIDAGCVQSAVPVPNVVGSVLAKVVEYWNRHGSGKEEEGLMEWDKEFVKLDRDELFDLMNAANFLSSKPLLDLCCQTVADTIKDMSVQEARDYFGIESDFTPEEEANVRDSNQWAFE